MGKNFRFFRFDRPTQVVWDNRDKVDEGRKQGARNGMRKINKEMALAKKYGLKWNKLKGVYE